MWEFINAHLIELLILATVGYGFKVIEEKLQTIIEMMAEKDGR